MTTQNFAIELLSATIGMATPYLLAALGETFAERSGILNLGIDGIMLLGAFAGFVGALISANIFFGLLLAIIAGGLLGFLMGFLSITIRGNQVISGLMIGTLATGLSIFLHKVIVGVRLITPRVETIKPWPIPFLADVPIIGPILFNQDPMAYMALLLVPISSLILFRTNLGLKIRAVGENPKASDTLGINVFRIRYVCMGIAGTLAGLAGSYLSLGRIGFFTEGISGGRGWIALAIVIFGRWNPARVLLGSILFGGADALQYRLQAMGGILMGVYIPPEFLLMLPYLLTMVVLVFIYRGAGAPSALGRPYKRGVT
ncbi:MAG: hypothetical protein APU95_04270 [Hadesarchaea archaeon YNP_N21]|jgi:ABC-type uncharacterized transport system permease subunit|nr:MAG: hypothetical protein APU95_04270 [Hadesarchaea archaeon YNP_N21]